MAGALSLSAVILTAAFSRDVKRHAVWLNWLILCK
jgi:hypothetical protein